LQYRIAPRHDTVLAFATSLIKYILWRRAHRDLLWLIVVVALSVLWWTDHKKVGSLERKLNKSRQEQEVAHWTGFFSG
jgi:hypothetical protein